MTIEAEIRELEAHLSNLASSKEEKIKIVSEAQSMAAKCGTERELGILILVKRRIIRGK